MRRNQHIRSVAAALLSTLGCRVQGSGTPSGILTVELRPYVIEVDVARGVARKRVGPEGEAPFRSKSGDLVIADGSQLRIFGPDDRDRTSAALGKERCYRNYCRPVLSPEGTVRCVRVLLSVVP